MTTNPPIDSDTNLEKLLNRSDIWRGNSYRPTPQTALGSGYKVINAALLNGGWPKSSLIEVCQKGLQLQEWLLFLPTLKTASGYIVLLNPPAIPFCQAFVQANIDLDHIVIVETNHKADFLASFAELARTEACEALFAWQQNQVLSYTELRKCLLATNEGAGLCVLFRPENAQQQSSPAVLRLQSQITSTHIQIKILKQKGVLQQQPQIINLPLPDTLKGFLPYSLLDKTILPGSADTTTPKRKSATIMSLKRGKK